MSWSLLEIGITEEPSGGAFGDGGGEEGWDEGASGSSAAMDEVRVGGRWRKSCLAVEERECGRESVEFEALRERFSWCPSKQDREYVAGDLLCVHTIYTTKSSPLFLMFHKRFFIDIRMSNFL